MADAADLKSAAARREGSSPSAPTTFDFKSRSFRAWNRDYDRRYQQPHHAGGKSARIVPGILGQVR